MRFKLGRALIGYAVPATRSRLAEIESELDMQRQERAQALRDLEAQLEEVQADVSRLEMAIAREREEHGSLMAVFETVSAISRDAIARVEAELRNEEAGLLSALAQRQILLGERRSLIASFRADAERLIRETRRRLSQQGIPGQPASRPAQGPNPLAAPDQRRKGPQLSEAGS